MSDKEQISFEEIDQWLRAGRNDEVRAKLQEVVPAKVPRERLADWANLARRAGLPSLSLRLLRPIIRIKRSLGDQPTFKERASYAASLAAVGALSEAHGMLDGAASEMVPEVQLFSGFCYVHSWDYAKALPFFERYLTLSQPSEFQKVVAKVNLAAAHCFLEGYDEVKALTESIIIDSQKNDWLVLQIEALLLSAQASILRSRWSDAKADLARAGELSPAKSLNQLLVDKWSLILGVRRDGYKSEVEKQLTKLSVQARERKFWELVRDCDYHLAIEKKDQALVERVYFGTPFAAYRERLLEMSREFFTPRASHEWRLGEKPGPKLDISKSSTKEIKRQNPIAMRVLRSLASDFYRPLKIGCLFNDIYPEEFYDPDSSPTRVKTALSRTRTHLKDLGFPLEIRCVKQDYYLASEAPVDLKVRLEYPEADSQSALPPDFLSKLRKTFHHKAFSSAQAAEIFGITPIKAQRFLRTAAKDNRVYGSGAARGRLYRFHR